MSQLQNSRNLPENLQDMLDPILWGLFVENALIRIIFGLWLNWDVYIEACKMLEDELGEKLFRIQIKSLCGVVSDRYTSFARLWFVKSGLNVQIHLAVGVDNSLGCVRFQDGRYSVLTFASFRDVFKFLLSASYIHIKPRLLNSTQVWTGNFDDLQLIANRFLEKKLIETSTVYENGRCIPQFSEHEQIEFFRNLEEIPEIATKILNKGNILELFAKFLNIMAGHYLEPREKFKVLE